MGKVTKKILGATRGKVGDVVFRKFRAANVNSAYQPNPNNPKTEAQMLQRGKFTTMTKYSRILAPAINLGLAWSTKGTMLSPRNKFITMNKGCFTSTEPDIVSVDFATMVLSLGVTGTVDYGTPQSDDPGSLELTWTQLVAGSHDGNKVRIVLLVRDAESTVISSPINSETGRVVMTFPTQWSGLQANVWAIEFAGDDYPEENILKGQPYASVYLGSTSLG